MNVQNQNQLILYDNRGLVKDFHILNHDGLYVNYECIGQLMLIRKTIFLLVVLVRDHFTLKIFFFIIFFFF